MTRLNYKFDSSLEILNKKLEIDKVTQGAKSKTGFRVCSLYVDFNMIPVMRKRAFGIFRPDQTQTGLRSHRS